MYRATLNYNKTTVVVTTESYDQIQTIFANLAKTYPGVKVTTETTTKTTSKPYKHFVLTEAMVPKHPGGRKPIPTNCPHCGHECESYTEARAHCFRVRLEKWKEKQ